MVLLDEASQMSEPVSLLPIARFGCHRLLLLGDPKVTFHIRYYDIFTLPVSRHLDDLNEYQTVNTNGFP